MFIFGKEKNTFAENKLIDKKPFIELSRKRALLWLFGIFFICCWMFVLGILVGRGTAPLHFSIENVDKNLEEELRVAVEKEKEETKILESDPPGQTPPDGKQNLEFYEDLKSTKDSAGDINMGKGDINNVPLKEPEPVKAPEPVKMAEQVKMQDKIVPGASGSPSQEKVPGPVFTVQTASGKEKKSAEKTVKALINKGYPAYVAMSEIPGKGTWYRVRIGEFKERKEAEKTLSRLGKDKIKGIIVTNGK
jgi:cell division protein FtsN